MASVPERQPPFWIPFPVSPRESCLIGAQMLVALSAVHELGYELSAFEVMPLLFYPSMLFISSLICIFLLPERGDRVKSKKINSGTLSTAHIKS